MVIYAIVSVLKQHSDKITNIMLIVLVILSILSLASFKYSIVDEKFRDVSKEYKLIETPNKLTNAFIYSILVCVLLILLVLIKTLINFF